MLGPLLVMLAAALWALDALLRTGLTRTIPSAWIVAIEHAIGFVLLTPFFVRSLPRLKQFGAGEWAVAIALTAVSSIAGTLLFTEALARSSAAFDFASPVLLQKLQPIFVILLAAIFLGERLTFRYLILVPVALIGSYLISFGAAPIPLTLTNTTLVYLLAVGAAAAWGSGTILSKILLKRLPFAEATSLRFLLAIPLGFATALALNPSYNPGNLTVSELLRFVIIAFTTGAGAVLIYYRGLTRTEAKIATIAELTFPIVSIGIAVTVLNPYGAPQVLSLANVFGIVVLLCAILAVSFDGRKLEHD
jgi:drug/metabolite transporter (DMT)-like permease